MKKPSVKKTKPKQLDQTPSAKKNIYPTLKKKASKIAKIIHHKILQQKKNTFKNIKKIQKKKEIAAIFSSNIGSEECYLRDSDPEGGLRTVRRCPAAAPRIRYAKGDGRANLEETTMTI